MKKSPNPAPIYSSFDESRLSSRAISISLVLFHGLSHPPGSIPGLNFEVPQAPTVSVAPPPARRWSNIGPTPPPRYLRLTGNVLRGVASLLTLIAAIVMGTAAQTKRVVVIDDSGSPVTLSGTAKSHYSSALVVKKKILHCDQRRHSFVLCINLALSAWNVVGGSFNLPLTIADLLAAMILVSCNSAASAISVVAENGNRHFGWDKICEFVGKYCAQVAAAVALSTFASVAYVLLILLTLVALHKRL
ncbi:hypothetical protein HPP92_016921 [Vanilla planifolia]|uniref:CASP-like protein n=1 Tax=Vanilla planifolia TaxID=51239 RepID=A0A835QG36_VANPL|nr:hypothetical protein HPP92_016921 [Vanilla planifolia]